MNSHLFTIYNAGFDTVREGNIKDLGAALVELFNENNKRRFTFVISTLL